MMKFGQGGLSFRWVQFYHFFSLIPYKHLCLKYLTKCSSSAKSVAPSGAGKVFIL